MTNAPWWNPQIYADRRPILQARARIMAAHRTWLQAQGFTEVDPPALAISPGNEAHLHGFATQIIGNDGRPAPLYLHTSPEFAMKKLLAAGETQIAAFSHVFRNRERGPLHSPEFTMLEWYRVGADYSVLMQDVAQLIALAAKAAGAAQLTYRARLCDPFAPPARITVQEAFLQYAKVDVLASIDENGATNTQLLADQARRIGLRVANDDTWADIFSRILSAHVEPNLGIGQLTILDHYPSAEAALARKLPHDVRLAQRFEVYACGVELANGFGELTDPNEQRRRFEIEMAEMQRVYGKSYPIDEDFLAALAHMPDSCGIAMGFDRVVMLASAAPHIDDVLWVPVARV